MRIVSLIFVAILFTSCARVNVFPYGEQDRPESTPTPSTSSPTSTAADDEPFEPWADVLKNTRPIDGLLRLHVKRDQTLYLELAPEQLKTDYGLVLHFSRGIGDFGAYDGLELADTRLIRFERVGDQINLVHRNDRFIADEGSAMATSMEDNVGHSLLYTADIESRNDSTRHVLIDVTEFIASDYPGLTEVFRRAYGSTSITFDDDRSFVEHVRGFPKNVEIDAALTYAATQSPSAATDAVSDYRALSVGVRYSIFELPKTPMRPRLADDRVGHFLTARKDFSRDAQRDPFVRYVHRWRLEKADPKADLSEPVQPIVFYIDRTVPEAYRPYVREGIEAWNEAFEEAGFKRAVVARDAPAASDSSWSAEDLRYSTVRWSAAHRMGFAIGPSQVDPRTGEILNADILISSIFVRAWLNEYEEMGPEALREHHKRQLEGFLDLPAMSRNRICTAAYGKARQLGLQHAVLAATGRIPPGAPMPEEYLGAAIRNLIMHEVGHTIGLRHNFKASSGIDYERLNDTTYTREHGLSLSVMDYAPVNISIDREEQGDYWNHTVGTYDTWAVKYAYMPVDETTARTSGTAESVSDDTTGEASGTSPFDERPALDAIAEQGTDPLHTYGTDEDNWLGAWAVDPLTNAWELGSEPIAFARDRARLVATIIPELDRRLIDEGDRYAPLRAAMISIINERISSLLPATKMIGGAYVARDHKGDPGARQPFTPVPASEQRAALQFIMDEVFSPHAFVLDAETLNKLAPNRYAHWGASVGVPIDFPLLDYADAVHSIFIDQLVHPARLQRLLNAEWRSAPDSTFAVGHMLAAMTTGIWSELSEGTAPNAFRRNLQRRYTDRLIRLMLASPPWRISSTSGAAAVPVPEHARSVSRLELMELHDRIEAALEFSEVDRDTRAHLIETQARIRKALDATVTTSAD